MGVALALGRVLHPRAHGRKGCALFAAELLDQPDAEVAFDAPPGALDGGACQHSREAAVVVGHVPQGCRVVEDLKRKVVVGVRVFDLYTCGVYPHQTQICMDSCTYIHTRTRARTEGL